uniref:Uncharacterized protein n=1 Tax=Salix viminalis TaxID=40686 RepID=A0A6N2K9J4_SALVM
MDSSPRSSITGKVKRTPWWMKSLTGWSYVIFEMLFQKMQARHLKNPLPLPPLHDVTCIVTGSTSGIGLETARQLLSLDLIMKWQDERHGTSLLSVEVMELNLLSLASVVRFARAWNLRSKPLQVLINNAGIFSMGEPQKFSEDGYETHLQVNFLAPALLSVLLLPSIIKGSPSRIINVNSIIHYMGFVDTDDMNFTSGKEKFNSTKAYSSSKLAQSCSTVSAETPAAPADEWPTCAYISHDCRPTRAAIEAHNTRAANEVWEKTLDMIGLPLDAVEKMIQGEEVMCKYRDS